MLNMLFTKSIELNATPVSFVVVFGVNTGLLIDDKLSINGDSFALILDLVLLTFDVPELGDFSLCDFDFFGVFNTIFGVFKNLPPITFKSEFLCLFFAPFSDNAELLSKFFFFLFLHFVLWESGFLLGELSDFFELSSEFSPVVKDNSLTA